ncbi:MAG: O-antigen ligase family protein [Thermoguttaceae bacterium]
MKKKSKTKFQQQAEPTKEPSLFSQRLIIISTLALVIAGLLFSGESLTRFGSGHIFTFLWLFLAAFTAIFAAICTPVSKRCGVTLSTIAVFVFFLWVAISAGVAVYENRANIRLTLNAVFIWTGLAAAFFMFKYVIQKLKGDKSIFLAVLVCVAFSQAILGFYQYGYEIPNTQREYEKQKAAPATFAGYLAPTGLTPDSKELKTFENRLYTQTPSGTFPLANTLAGLLAPMLILALGIVLFLRGKLKDRIGLGIIVSVLGLCLLFTHSRTGVIAACLGVVLLAATKFVCGKTEIEKEVKDVKDDTATRNYGVIAGVVSLLLLVVLVGVFSTDFFATAKRSLGFRLEYWQACWKMVQDAPLFGCGTGNFQQIYMQYKLPFSSEEIADPHNFIMEIWTNAGTPALFAFLVFLGCVFIGRANSCSQNSESSNNDTSNCNAANCEKSRENDRNENFSAAKLLFPIGSLFGFGVAYVGGLLSEFPFSPTNFVVIVIGYVLGSLLLYSYVFRLDNAVSRQNCLLRIVLLVLLVNLLAAGGIAYPNIALPFWLISAMLVSENGVVLFKGAVPLRLAYSLFFVLFVILAGACGNLSYYPCIESSDMVAKSISERNLSRRIELMQAAVVKDPLSADAKLDLARLQLAVYESKPAENGVYRNLAIGLQELGIAKNPKSATYYLQCGNDLRNTYRRTGDRSLLPVAVKRYKKAVELYPNHAKTHAALAIALWDLGDNDSKSAAAEEAQKALDLNSAMPHDDQKLPEDVVKQLNSFVYR